MTRVPLYHKTTSDVHCRVQFLSVLTSSTLACQETVSPKRDGEKSKEREAKRVFVMREV